MDTTKAHDKVALSKTPPEVSIGDPSKDTRTVCVSTETAPATEKTLRKGLRERATSARLHPYCGGKQSVVVASADLTQKTSYMAQLKATWPARYWKLKVSFITDTKDM